MNKGLGRVHIPDERDREFLMRSVLPKKAAVKSRYWWQGGWWGDQGSKPHCVAFSWAHWLEDGPVTQTGKAPCINTTETYLEAQKNDAWPGEAYDGTSVRAGAKVLMDKGFIASYYWTWNVADLATAVLSTGPVVVGTNWHEGMSNPNPKTGIMTATGEVQGGHAYLINGVNTDTKMFRIKNSWGRGWGKNGNAYISFDDMQKLLDAYGEACLAVETQKQPK